VLTWTPVKGGGKRECETGKEKGGSKKKKTIRDKRFRQRKTLKNSGGKGAILTLSERSGRKKNEVERGRRKD